MSQETVPHDKEEVEASGATGVDRRLLGSWFAPWLTGAALIAIMLLGLWAASHTRDDGTYAAGLITAGLALVALGWEVKGGFDGNPPAIFVDTADALLILEALLTLLALGGLILTGLSRDFTWRSAGAALFLICFGLALANLKHYFDRQEGRR